MLLKPEEQIKLNLYFLNKSQRQNEALIKSYKNLEKLLKKYKERVNDPHIIYVEKIKQKKKQRRLKNKAKGPRK